LTWYLSQLGTYVANEFPLAAASCGNIQQGVAAYETSNQEANTNMEYTIKEVGDRQYCNGVDVTDQLCKYNPDKWSRSPYELKGEIFRKKQEQGGGGGRGRGCRRGKGHGGSSVASLSSQIQAMQATIAALAMGNNDMFTLTNLPTPPAQTPTPPSLTDQSTALEASKWISPPDGGLKLNNHGCGIAISNMRPSATNQSLPMPISVSAYNLNSHVVGCLEEDSHVDIHSAGKNCIMLSTTGFCCDVTPFHDSYKPKTDVEIVQSATAYQHDNGIVYYLIMSESLWFGGDMEHSLLIARNAGVSLCTDPYDQCWHLGITLNDEEILPFQRVRNTIGCETFKPLQDKVLLAMSQHHPNVIYLNPDWQPHPRDTLVIQSTRLHEEYGDGDKDLRLLLVYFPVDTDE
jgi:hypothetical protein